MSCIEGPIVSPFSNYGIVVIHPVMQDYGQISDTVGQVGRANSWRMSGNLIHHCSRQEGREDATTVPTSRV